MTELTRTLYLGLACDKRGCATRFRDNEPGYDERAMESRAVAMGWTRWAGNRCYRWYCPDHGPARPGRKSDARNLHTMWRTDPPEARHD